ncbi:hypothetical protein L915_00952, partial [Phytophthora nicotianae]
QAWGSIEKGELLSYLQGQGHIYWFRKTTGWAAEFGRSMLKSYRSSK